MSKHQEYEEPAIEFVQLAKEDIIVTSYGCPKDTSCVLDNICVEDWL